MRKQFKQGSREGVVNYHYWVPVKLMSLVKMVLVIILIIMGYLTSFCTRVFHLHAFGLIYIKPGSYYANAKRIWRHNPPLAAILASESSRVELLRIIRCEFVTSTFASHSHSQEVWTGLHTARTLPVWIKPHCYLLIIE